MEENNKTELNTGQEHKERNGVVNGLLASFKGKRPAKENFVVLILIGVLLLVIVWPVSDDKKNTDTTSMPAPVKGMEEMLKSTNKTLVEDADQPSFMDKNSGDYAAYLEKALEDVLSSMEGAGKVKVMVTLKDSGEALIEKDTVSKRAGTTEVDSAGGSRNTSDIQSEEETIYTADQDGNNRPYVRQVTTPQIKGVVVSAQGGGKTQVVKNITEAVQALFGIDAHKIKVVKMITDQ